MAKAKVLPGVRSAGNFLPYPMPRVLSSLIEAPVRLVLDVGERHGSRRRAVLAVFAAWARASSHPMLGGTSPVPGDLARDVLP